MKTPSDELFKLIKSLNTQEKVYFKKYAARRKADNYSISLFDSINTISTFNEDEIKNKLKNVKLVKNFNRFKNYTYELLLKSLSEYYSDSTIDSKLQNLLRYAEILMQKRLFKTERKVLLKAEKIALEHEKFGFLAIILSYKRALLIHENNYDGLEMYLKNEAKSELEYIRILKNIAEFRNLSNEMDLINFKYQNVREKKHLIRIKTILKSPLLLSPEKIKSFSETKFFYIINVIGYSLLNQWARANDFQQKFINYLEVDIKRLQAHIADYFIGLSNILNANINLDRIKKCDDIYNKAFSVYTSSPSKIRHKITSYNFMYVSINYMELMTLKGLPDKALSVWKKTADAIPQKFTKKELHVTLRYYLFYSNFLLGNFHEALTWVHTIVNYRSKLRLDTQAAARIHLLIVHYELGNQDLLPYLAKQSKKDLKKMNALYPIENKLIDFFASTGPHINSKKNEHIAFKKLKEGISKMLPDAADTKIMDGFDFLGWIDSKLVNKSFVEVIREKSKKQY